jgi:hypothetical protein
MNVSLPRAPARLAGNIYYSSYVEKAVFKVTPAGYVNQFKNQLPNYAQGIAR